MPQLWKTSRSSEGSAGSKSAMNGVNKMGTKSLPPLTIHPPDHNGLDSPATDATPSSPKYDQVIMELRVAQERLCRNKEPFQEPVQVVDVDNRWRAQRNHETKNGNQHKQMANSSPSSFNSKTGPKKVRFLEDITGNLHTSVFGSSTESLGSLLDAQGLPGSEELSMDHVISSLTNYDNEMNLEPVTFHLPLQTNSLNGKMNDDNQKGLYHNGGSSNGGPVVRRPTPPVRMDDFRIPSIVLEVLKSSSPEPNSKVEITDLQSRVQNFLDTFRTDDTDDVDHEQTVVHLEPDDPNSVDSGSVLSELDFEETSSTVTTESTKTDSLNSPVLKYEPKPLTINRREDTSDLFAEVSDLLERSLQEIRRMEEDTVKIFQPDKSNHVTPNTTVCKREPLYELIGRKRTPPAQLNFRSSPLQNAELCLPVSGNEVWIPRKDWIPPSSKQIQYPPGDIWIPRSGMPINKNGSHQSPCRNGTEDNAIYGRLWESSSPRTNNQENSNGRHSNNRHPKLQPAGSPHSEDLTVIRSMARKARLEHWRLAGIPTTDSEDGKADHPHSDSPLGPSNTGLLSALPLVQIPVKQTNEDAIRNKKLGFQLTWPPPPIPQSPCSSSASATPVSPTCSNFPALENPQNSPKCFGHEHEFQWPVPPIPNKQNKLIQRTGSFRQDAMTESCSSTEPGVARKCTLKRSESLKEKQRPPKPVNLEAAQDWYWVEEFPQGSGIEPGTGNMSTWFHGAISRNEAEVRLSNQPTGAFLARLTERLWGYALSVKNVSGQVSHFLIDAGERHTHKKYTVLGSPDPPQKSLRDLIQYYAKHALTPDKQERLLFPCPQESAIRCSSRQK